ncbi:MAG: response regulator [Bacteroidota bacterium]|nr:response regulator [Bacteroidota bacterium]
MMKLNKVFLVDDDETSNFLNTLLIRSMKITDKVEISKNGKEALTKFVALKQLDKEWPELVLLDLNMPVMDGFEFLEEYCKLYAEEQEQTKIVMLTSSNSPKDIDKAKKYNIAGYINKPLTEEKLHNVIL